MKKKDLCRTLSKAHLLETRVSNSMYHLQESVVTSFNALANISPQLALEVLESISEFKNLLEKNIKDGEESVEASAEMLIKKLHIEDNSN